jgi:hypothetical protein
MELESTVYRSKERAIEPPATLRDQLGNLNGMGQSSWDVFPRQISTHLIRRIGNGVRRLDVVKDPCSTSFRHEFPAQDL